MLLADSNIWLALALSKHDFHPSAASWLLQRKPSEKVLFCRSTQQSFLRLLTTHAVFAPFAIPPLNNKAAWSTYEGFRSDKRISWAEEPSGLDLLWKKLTVWPKAAPKLWMDAYLAAFAMAGGYELVTTDQGFKQFKGLQIQILPK